MPNVVTKCCYNNIQARSGEENMQIFWSSCLKNAHIFCYKINFCLQNSASIQPKTLSSPQNLVLKIRKIFVTLLLLLLQPSQRGPRIHVGTHVDGRRHRAGRYQGLDDEHVPVPGEFDSSITTRGGARGGGRRSFFRQPTYQPFYHPLFCNIYRS